MLINDKSQSKLARVSADLTDSGRLFHTVGPATRRLGLQT